MHTQVWRRPGALILILALSAAAPAQAGNCFGHQRDAGPSTAPRSGHWVTVRIDDPESPNLPVVKVRVCEPDPPGQCATLRRVALDTGSVGLRVFGSALKDLNLPPLLGQNGAALLACHPFAAGYVWGGMRRALVGIGHADGVEAIPIQVIDVGPDKVPAHLSCTAQGPDFGPALASKVDGILGIGPGQVDCDADCTVPQPQPLYFLCTSPGACDIAMVPRNLQARNPVQALDPDFRAGYQLRLPAVDAPDGTTSVRGRLVLGLNTRANNAVPEDATTFAIDSVQHFEHWDEDVGGASQQSGGRVVSTEVWAWGNQALFEPAPAGVTLDTGATHVTSDLRLPLCKSPELRDLYCPRPSTSAPISPPGSRHGAGTIHPADPTVAAQHGHAALPGLTGPSALAGYVQLGVPNLYGLNLVVHIDAQTNNPLAVTIVGADRRT